MGALTGPAALIAGAAVAAVAVIAGGAIVVSNVLGGGGAPPTAAESSTSETVAPSDATSGQEADTPAVTKPALRNGECRRPTRSGGSEIDRGLSMMEVLTLAIRKTSTCLTLPSCPLI